MSEPKTKAGVVREIVETVVLFGACGILAWVTNTVIEQGKFISAHATMLNVNAERILSLETRGSRSLESHEKMDDQRVTDLSKRMDKVEQMMTLLSPLPTKIEYIAESQKRIEKLFEDHLKQRSP